MFILFLLNLNTYLKNAPTNGQRLTVTIHGVQLVLTINEPYDVKVLNKRTCDALSYVSKARRKQQ